jgi:RNA polymerase sigma factor (sigma-70 family)
MTPRSWRASVRFPETESEQRVHRIRANGGGDEGALVAAAAKGDRQAGEDLLEAMAPLIAGLARQYQRHPGVGRDELLQEGALGVLRAAKRYDGSFDTPFSAYASWWVRQGMQRVASELSGPLVLSDRAHRQLARMRAARRADLQRTGREPSAARLAELSGLPLERIASLAVAERPPRTLDGTAAAEEDGQPPHEWLDDPGALEAYDGVLERLTLRRLDDMGAILSDRECRVISARYGIGQPALKLAQIGALVGVSAERARQIQEEALAKLRHALGSEPDHRT